MSLTKVNLHFFPTKTPSKIWGEKSHLRVHLVSAATPINCPVKERIWEELY